MTRRFGAFQLAAAWLGAAALVVASSAAAQEAVAPREGDVVAWHTVKDGETLERITQRYLGTVRLWPENWRLNPDLKDPHRLTPGQRIRVITKRPGAARFAKVTVVERRVDEKPHPDDWAPARVGDRLKERDGVRTLARSSTELAFDDGSKLAMTENSLVFLREVSAGTAGIGRQALEIVEGQADVEARPVAGRSPDIEVVVAGAKTRPRAADDPKALARARLPKSGEAQVMVYGGASEVEAAGTKVDVPRGMGTSVPPGGAPRPPERLLPPPRPVAPDRSFAGSYANPRFQWRAVDGAASYTLEICHDAACARLVGRVTGLTSSSALVGEGLPQGELRWRVTAVAASGLDGFPSETLAFAVRTDQMDAAAPVVAVLLEGDASPTPSGAVAVGPTGALLPAVRDDVSGVAETRYRWDGGAWQVFSNGPLAPPTRTERHLLELASTDRLGRVSPVTSVAVVPRADAPEAAKAP